MEGQVVASDERGSDRFWDTYSRYYDTVYHLMPYRKLLWDSYQALDLRPGMAVLDAGCGTGNFEAFIHEKESPPVSIEAVDFSCGMLGIAQTKCSSLMNVTFRQADLNSELPFADASFDRIVSINVLYALDDWDGTMREFLRVLKPDGKLVLTSSFPEFSFGSVLADHFRRVKNIWGFSRQARTVLTTVGVLATSGLGSAVLNIFVIDRREAEGRYRSLDRDGIREFLRSHDADGVGDVQVGLTFADQNFLAVATKAMVAQPN